MCPNDWSTWTSTLGLVPGGAVLGVGRARRLSSRSTPSSRRAPPSSDGGRHGSASHRSPAEGPGLQAKPGLAPGNARDRALEAVTQEDCGAVEHLDLVIVLAQGGGES